MDLVDVQYELVDHLASAIEVEMNQDDKLTFEQALRKVYGRFPITGFSQFVSEKSAALNKYWQRRIWYVYLQYLTPPKLLATALLGVTCYQLMSFFPSISLDLLLLALILQIIGQFAMQLKLRKMVRQKKNYLFIGTFRLTIFSPLFLWYFIIIYFSNFLSDFDAPLNVNHRLFYSFFITATSMFTHANLSVLPHMLKDEIARKYGHLQIIT